MGGHMILDSPLFLHFTSEWTTDILWTDDSRLLQE